MRDDGVVEIMDFDYDPTPKRFRFYRGGHVFEAAPELPLDTIAVSQELAREIQASAQDKQNVDARAIMKPLTTFFESILLDEHIPALHAGLATKEQPIGPIMMQRAFVWLMESYGLRPTVPSSDSSSSSPDDGSTTSTAGALPEGSTLSASASPDSSISFTPTSSSVASDS
jgi:hypothetical protein